MQDEASDFGYYEDDAFQAFLAEHDEFDYLDVPFEMCAEYFDELAAIAAAGRWYWIRWRAIDWLDRLPVRSRAKINLVDWLDEWSQQRLFRAYRREQVSNRLEVRPG